MPNILLRLSLNDTSNSVTKLSSTRSSITFQSALYRNENLQNHTGYWKLLRSVSWNLGTTRWPLQPILLELQAHRVCLYRVAIRVRAMPHNLNVYPNIHEVSQFAWIVNRLFSTQFSDDTIDCGLYSAQNLVALRYDEEKYKMPQEKAKGIEPLPAELPCYEWVTLVAD